jgi:hypothetical protein
MILVSSSDIDELAEQVVDRLRKGQAATHELREEIETLTIEKERREEEFARREREVEHKVGLERKRQEFEVDAAKREAVVTVREENLKADKKRFEEAMKAQSERLDDMKELLLEMMKRLPTANIDIKEERRRGRAV